MKFAYTILYVNDVTASIEFYERAFGMTRRFVHESNTYAELETEGTTLSFAQHDLARSNLPIDFVKSSLQQAPAGFEIGISTDDVPAAYALAIAAGATPLAEPKTKPWGQVVAYVRDLDGVLVELCTPMGL
ncbi:Glyoxalase/bleomycin resistance protein/dioxygenase [Pirellula staleyi DSM 6068]|uniref:Glyoxalase/bleomycin resistance protein/dioxygenase n=1 Tax=Pirellula staleyi (strain ATCC 27377 / DSM 6068 / ICPB 4128) TaxID=530564 RepID=D2R7P1_PIRSD|nr:VOC family protein [Pirellula staleyi]ADB17467.1 Glyoxalase/bleomycin resistance protein/dioxygenase [Pirellula staleyi DSM 6068]